MGTERSVSLVDEHAPFLSSQYNVDNFISDTFSLAGMVSGLSSARILFSLNEDSAPYGTRIELDNVIVSAVPLPAAAWLFGSAIFGFMAYSRKKKFQA